MCYQTTEERVIAAQKIQLRFLVSRLLRLEREHNISELRCMEPGCNKAGTDRGICGRHHHMRQRQVAAGTQTWANLESDGLCLPAARPPAPKILRLEEGIPLQEMELQEAVS